LLENAHGASILSLIRTKAFHPVRLGALLRQRMIEDMTMRRLAPATQRGYLRAVERFTRFYGASPDSADAEDLRRFQLHMASDGASATTINQTLTGLRFFFKTTVSRPEVLANVSSVHMPEKLPAILSPEQVGRLLEAAGSLKYKAAFSVAYGAGRDRGDRTSEQGRHL
jgi:site-specific recombinase XerD